jgi:hypothetical protein
MLGYEALIRGPMGSPWAAPDALFRLAQDDPATIALEVDAARTALLARRSLHLPGKLVLNFSPQTLRHLLASARPPAWRCSTSWRLPRRCRRSARQLPGGLGVATRAIAFGSLGLSASTSSR